MSALLPPALLLLWSGLAATLLVSLLAAPLFGSPPAVLAPALRRPALGSALLCGTLLYPLAYGAAFTLLHEASIVTGALLGALQAFVFAFRSLREGGRPLLGANLDRILLRIAYGMLLGFIYVTP